MDDVTEEEDDVDASGFIVNGRRLLLPAKITGSIASRNEFLPGNSLDRSFGSVLRSTHQAALCQS